MIFLVVCTALAIMIVPSLAWLISGGACPQNDDIINPRPSDKEDDQ